MLTHGVVKSQQKKISGIDNISVRSTGDIVNSNDDVTGYYLFYKTDKVDHKMNAYDIVILDGNLKQTARKRIIETKNTTLIESAYNGKYLIFKFLDTKEDVVRYRIMDNTGKLSKGLTRPLDKYELKKLLLAGNNNIGLSAISQKGFIDIYDVKDKVVRYNVLFIGNDGKKKWTYKSKNTGKHKTANLLQTDKNRILLMETSAMSAMSKDFTFSLMALDFEGKKVYNVPLTSGKYNLMPHSVTTNPENGNFVFIGEYYNKSEKMMKAESQGVFLRGINDKGVWGKSKYLDWDTDIKPKLKASQLAEIENFSVFFHDVLRTENGKIIVIGEGYKKSASGFGIASKILGGGQSGASVVDLKIGNMVVMEIGSDLDLEKINIFKKREHDILLPSGFEYLNKHVIGKFMASNGEFDYEFVEFNKDHSVLTIAYLDRENNEEGKKKSHPIIHLKSFVEEDNEFTDDKITLATDAKTIWVSRAKPGFIIIYEYFKKEKYITMHLEPINY